MATAPQEDGDTQPADAAEGDAAPEMPSESAGDAAESTAPEELFESYVFPDTRQRQITGIGLSVIGVVAVVVWFAWGSGSDGLSVGILVGGIVCLAIAAYFFAAAFRMRLDQSEALVVATREIGFPVGHASAVLGWRGWRSRPTWRILLYSAEDPPARRGLVELDAIDGNVLASYSEENPEDWEALRREEQERPD